MHEVSNRRSSGWRLPLLAPHTCRASVSSEERDSLPLWAGLSANGKPAAPLQTDPSGAFWSRPAAEIFQELGSSPAGLSAAEAARRLALGGTGVVGRRGRSNVPTLLARQFTSPIVLILIAAAALSFVLRDPTDGAIILAIVLVSGLLGFWQEHGAATAVDRLLAIVELKARVLRGGEPTQVPVDEVVPGDVVLLSAGSAIPADCRLIESRDLFVDEATLTGETFPVEKQAGVLPPETALARRTNVLFMGTHVVSGSGRAVVAQTGRATEFGKIADRLRLRPQETEFEGGVRHFGFFLMEVTLLLVVAIFAINVYLQRPVLDSFLFSLALAVGLTPQLLPAIISVNLATGARSMAGKKVIVKRLASLENFGSMDVLCSDKTGTLTQGAMRLHSAIGAEGQESDRVLLCALINASFQTGFANPIDEAIRAERAFDTGDWERLDEVPYDFNRKRLSVLARGGERSLMVTKGALLGVLEVCAHAEMADGRVVSMEEAEAGIRERYTALSARGFRTLGVALREMGAREAIRKDDESEMTFVGFLVLHDPPKPGIAETVAKLRGLGVSLKVITGDNALVATQVGAQVGLSDVRVLSGPGLGRASDEALMAMAREADIFAEIEPNQKERIILALRKGGHVVGYMGDGINDAPALHAADVGISVQGAVDVAKDAADIVLLEQDLAVLEDGVREGRKTFANTMKYVFMATSANFGNMFSMAGASLFLPFLPLLPKQILLTNLMTDSPEMTIASDRVDPDWIEQSRRWDIGFIRRFMMTFGLLSSVFDYLTFGVLLLLLRASPAEFRTGWFVESVVSATLIVLVIRTRGGLLHSRPSKALLAATLLVAAATVALPYTPLGALFDLVPLPPMFLGMMGLIVLGYVASAEVAKALFYRRVGF